MGIFKPDTVSQSPAAGFRNKEASTSNSFNASRSPCGRCIVCINREKWLTVTLTVSFYHQYINI